MVLSMHTLDLEKLKWPGVVERTRFEGPGPFVPYRFEDPSDVPAFLPIGADEVVRFTTSMHDEHAYLTKVPAKVERKFRHLEEKIEKHGDMIESVQKDLEEGADALVLSYGLNAALCKEAVQTVRNEGAKCSLLIVESLFPIPERSLSEALRGIKKVILPEMNLSLYAGAIEHLIPAGVELISIPRIDGELITVEDVVTKGGLM
jgi:2-oxoglutarate ferredoxin oxidoreductase subunit alpha